MRTLIHIDGKPLELTMSDFEDSIDLDDMTRVHYENLIGDAITVSALLNKVGILKAKAESNYNHKKLDFEIYESRLRKNFRREAIENNGKILVEKELIKLTEKSLDEASILDKAWQINKKNMFKAQEDLSKIDSFYWAVQSKDKKLNNLITGITDEQLWHELVEGKINGIMIKKAKSITQRTRG